MKVIVQNTVVHVIQCGSEEGILASHLESLRLRKHNRNLVLSFITVLKGPLFDYIQPV
jgi:hypothetical protein